jgi:hypothetical protein
VLSVFLGLMICFRIGTELPFANYLWGPNGIAVGETCVAFFGPLLGPILDAAFYNSSFGIYILITILFISALCLIFNVKTRVAAFFAAFSFILLELRLPAIGDGGDNITRLTFIYMILLMSNPRQENASKTKIWIHNIGVASIMVQLMILYEVSGFMKATGEKWQNGTAMYIISNVEWFSLPGVREMFKNPYITTIFSYIPMFFMIFFPIAIFSRFKFIWIGIGILLHVGIAYTMGLITFTLAMVGLELFLITDEEYARIKVFVLNSWLYKKTEPLVQSALAFFKNEKPIPESVTSDNEKPITNE